MNTIVERRQLLEQEAREIDQCSAAEHAHITAVRRYGRHSLEAMQACVRLAAAKADLTRTQTRLAQLGRRELEDLRYALDRLPGARAVGSYGAGGGYRSTVLLAL